MADHKPVHPLVQEARKLQKPISGRRLLSWVLFLTLGLLCLGLPIAASMYPAQTAQYAQQIPFLKDIVGNQPSANVAQAPSAPAHKGLVLNSVSTAEWEASRPVPATWKALDRMWNPGHSISNAHRRWVNDCKACHTQPFVQVRDEDCKTCHKNTADHVSAQTAKVSKLQDVSCASCHREHHGEEGLALQNKYFMSSNCADCHKDIKKTMPTSETGNAGDFYKNHPDFRYLIAGSADAKKLSRTRMPENGILSEKTGLKFPHDVHLKSEGIKSPEGKEKLNCASCHHANADGLTFQPVSMEKDCQRCHALSFDPAVSNRQVPHGSVDQVLSTLREFYSYTQLNGIPLDTKSNVSAINVIRPGKEDAPPVSFTKSQGDPHSRATAAAISLFEKTSCNVCHQVSRTNEVAKAHTSGQDLPQWKIAAVTKEHAWLGKSAFAFSHEKHKAADCSECHEASKSKKAEDVLMPSIKVCRDCHAGSEPVSNKLVSDCGLCHGFHQHPESP